MNAPLRSDPDTLDLAACRAAQAFTYREAYRYAGSLRLEGEHDGRPLKCPCCRWWHVLIVRARP